MEKGKLKEMFVKGNMPAGAEYKAALQDVLHTFPYFQLAQVLFAKQMYDTHEPEASGRIKLASVYAPDRKAMYVLFKKPAGKESEVKMATPVSAGNSNEKIKYNFVYSSTVSDDAGIINIPIKKEAETESLSETFVRKELEAKPPVSVASEKVEKVKETEVIPLKKAYTKPTIEKKRSLYAKKTEQPIVKLAVIPKPPPVEEAKPVISIIEEKKIEPENVAVPQIITPVEAKIETPVIEIKETKVETSPIIEIQNLLPEVLNEPIADTNLKYSFNSWLHVLPEIGVGRKEDTKPLTHSQASSIIDRFLKEEPSISRPKAEFFSPVKAAKQSIKEDEALISETLAKIFFEQGNLNKALKAYQTLLLWIPEKKNIFAPRIQEIESLIHKNTKPGTK